jgi:hypothetical protein
MLFTDYQAVYTDFILDFNRRLDKFTDNWAAIVDRKASEADLQDFIFNLDSLRASFKRYPEDMHFEALQPHVEIIFATVNYHIEDIREITQEHLSRLDKQIEALEFYTWNILNN